MTDQVLLRISFGVAAFIFELVLFILLKVLGHGQRDNNMKFQTLVILVLLGTAASIMDNVFRVSDLFGAPQALQVFLQLSVLVLNVFLTYYVFLYLGTFVKNIRKRPWRPVNHAIIVGSVLLAIALFIQTLTRLHGGAEVVEIPTIGRIIIGYVVELYFLIFSIVLVFRFHNSFDRRSLLTALGAYTAIISTIVLQLLETRGMLLNYFGAVIGSYIFYIGVEIPDHRNLIKSVHIVETLAEAIDAKDTYTRGHSSRVAAYSREIARRAGYSEAAQNIVYMMGLLHDVGKIGVPDAVINKPGRLDDDEFLQIKAHPGKGAKILSSMPELVAGARSHHERFDGRGYPDGLTGHAIPEEARIIAVADAYDAMTSNRSYRKGMEQQKVREQIERGKGTQFDPRFADIMLQMIDEDTDYVMREV
ncbi:MAG: HD-GYP domain-containing protein [bacterium]